MRVAFVLEDLLTGGAQVHAVDLSARLRARGFEPRLYVLGREAAAPLAQAAGGELTLLGQRGLGDPGEWTRLARRLGAAGADLTVAVGPVATCVTAAARLSGRLAGGLLSIFHCSTVGSAAGWLRIGPYLGAARACDGLVFVSELQRRRWRRRHLAAPRVRVIRNGVDLSHHRAVDPSRRREAKRRLGLDPSGFVIGSVAMFRPEKNHAGMIEALQALRDGGLGAQLLLVGDGPTRSRIEGLVRQRRLEAQVVFAGEQADVRPYLAAMDVGLLCSTRVETLPLFGLELMAAGAPLVAPRIGGLEELVADGVDGLLFPPGDGAALVRQLTRSADPVLRQRLSRAASDKVQGFCVEAMTDRYAALAVELVERRRR